MNNKETPTRNVSPILTITRTKRVRKSADTSRILKVTSKHKARQKIHQESVWHPYFPADYRHHSRVKLMWNASHIREVKRQLEKLQRSIEERSMNLNDSSCYNPLSHPHMTTGSDNSDIWKFNSKPSIKVKIDQHSKAEVFQYWSRLHATQVYPHIWKLAHAVPPVFINNCVDVAAHIPGAVTSRTQESGVRGDASHRKVFDALRLLNIQFERQGMETMFIIGRLMYENVLIWLTNAPDVLGQQYVQDKCPDVCLTRQSPNRYFAIPFDSSHERHELNILVLHKQKGIVFFQVKAIDGYTHVDEETTVRKIASTYKQLGVDVSVLNCVAGQDCGEFSTKVIAFPNMSRSTVASLPVDEKQNAVFLCKEDLPIHDINAAESELDLKAFRSWWNNLPNKLIPDKFKLEDIIGRYVGVLSAPVKFEASSLRSHVRNIKDVVLYTAIQSRRLILTHQQEQILSERGLHRVYLRAPPGSGATMMLVLKARMFLAEDEAHHVIVVNMYRGAKGRFGGHMIHSAIEGDDHGYFCNRVHHVMIDVDDPTTNLVTKLDKLHFPPHHTNANLMFVIDDIHAPRFWKHVLNSLLSEFTYSTVWCSGILGQNPDRKSFAERQLDSVLRCPPSVQNVLYHVDWDETRKTSYTCDATCKELSTTGPTTLSIRHGQHRSSNPLISVTDCSACAIELARLLQDSDKLGLIATNTDIPTTGARFLSAGAVTCDVVILVGIPDKLLQKSKSGLEYVETSKETLEVYMNYIEDCDFIQTLRQNLHVGVNIIKRPDTLDLQKLKNRTEVLVAWVDNFQGLESDVVIYLPGDVMREEMCNSSSRARLANNNWMPLTFSFRPDDVTEVDAMHFEESEIISISPGSSKYVVSIDRSNETDVISSKTIDEDSDLKENGFHKSAISTLKTTYAQEIDLINKKTTEHAKLDQAEPKPVFLSKRRLLPALGMSSISAPKNLRIEVEKEKMFAPPPPNRVGLGQFYWRSSDIQNYSDWDKTNLFLAASWCVAQLILLVP